MLDFNQETQTSKPEQGKACAPQTSSPNSVKANYVSTLRCDRSGSEKTQVPRGVWFRGGQLAARKPMKSGLKHLTLTLRGNLAGGFGCKVQPDGNRINWQTFVYRTSFAKRFVCCLRRRLERNALTVAAVANKSSCFTKSRFFFTSSARPSSQCK